MRDGTARTGRYAPGSWTLMCGERTWLLADISEPLAELEELWSLLDSSAALALVLDALRQVGLSRIPSFALIHLERGAEKAVLRGVAVIRLRESHGDAVELTCPPGLASWLEYPIEGRLTNVHLAAGGDVAPASWLPISGGVALASAAEVWNALRQVESVPPTTAAEAVEAAEEQPAEAVEAAGSVGSASGEVRENSPERDGGHYDFLFEATQRRTIEDAAVSEPEEQEPQLPPPSVAGVEDPSLTLIGEPETTGLGVRIDEDVAGDPAPDAPPVEPRERGGLILSVPGIVSAPSRGDQLQQSGTPATPLSEVDDRTVTRARVDALVISGHRQPTGPVVKAVPCPAGHPNPPHNATCRVCGVALPAATPVTVPRPVLGVLRLSTGASVPLDRGAILGRSPDATSGDDGQRPHVVALPSPEKDISRNHLEVKLDGWHVLVIDLRSTNGTFVTVPGESPQRLRPDDPFPIPPGTIVNLADEVTFVYEVEG